MEQPYDEIKEDLGGTWILERSENVEAYLNAMGFGNCERKSFSGDSLKLMIDVIDDVIHLEMQYDIRKCQTRFRLNEEFIINAGKPSKALASWENKILTVRVRRIDSGLTQIIRRKREKDKLVQSMTYNGVTCRRFMKRQS